MKKVRILFFVSSQSKIKKTNDPDYNGEALVFGTGGNASVHYVSGKFSTSGDCIVAFVKKNKHAAKAINYYLRGNMRLLEAGFKGAGLKHISKKYISDLQLPSLKGLDVEHILQILDKADGVREQRQKSLDTLNDLVRFNFLDMFGDPISNPKKWDKKPLSKILSSIDSGKSPRCLDRKATQDEYGILKLSAVSSYEFIEDENKAVFDDFKIDPRHLVKKGDLLFSRKNTYELVGAVALVNQNVNNLLMPDLIFRLNIDKNSKTLAPFLWCLLSLPHCHHEIRKIASGAAGSMPNISKARLMDLSLISPPEKIQKEFCDFYYKVVQLKNNMKFAHAEDCDFFNTLTQSAFNGDL